MGAYDELKTPGEVAVFVGHRAAGQMRDEAREALLEVLCEVGLHVSARALGDLGREAEDAAASDAAVARCQDEFGRGGCDKARAWLIAHLSRLSVVMRERHGLTVKIGVLVEHAEAEGA